MDALRLLGSLLGNNATSSGPGGQILGQLIGGLTSGGAQSGAGGLADMLGSLMGGHAQSSGTGGLADIVSSLARAGVQGGITHSGSGADLLGGLAMAALQMLGHGSAATGQSSRFGLAEMLAPGQASPAAIDTTQTHQQALAFVKAMINAAKADGQIDAEEQQKIISKLTDIGPQEGMFIQEEINKPLNFDFLADITQDMAPQVYAVSLMAINLDTDAEQNYMQQLVQSLGLNAGTVNSIHAQLGLAPLYG